jgi:hypothetical protein
VKKKMEQEDSETAEAIRRSFAEMEEGNVVDALDSIARSLRLLGNADAATPMGAIEAHGKVIDDAAQLIANALNNVAEAIRELAEKK